MISNRRFGIVPLADFDKIPILRRGEGGLNRSVTAFVILVDANKVIPVQPSDTETPPHVHPGEISAYEYHAIILDFDIIYVIVGSHTAVESGIQRTIGVEPGDITTDYAIDGCERTADEHFAI